MKSGAIYVPLPVYGLPTYKNDGGHQAAVKLVLFNV